jgi:hypothetical protein
VQHAGNLDQARFGRTIEDDMRGIGDRRLKAFGAAMADMKAADTLGELAAIGRRAPLGISRDSPQRRRQQCAIANAGLGAMHLLADP